MSGFFIAVIVILAVVGRIREAMKDAQKDGSRDQSGGRTLPDGTPVQPAESFSLQAVLAEIQKVKEQSEGSSGSMQAGSVRDQIRRAALTQERKQELAERAERKRRELAAARNVEPARPLVRHSISAPEPQSVAAESDIAAARAVPDSQAPQTTTTSPVTANVQLRPNPAQMRDAIVWREILSVPVSLRDEETL